MSETYREMVELVREIADINYATAVLGWDQQTYMPEKGETGRGRQISLLSAIAHQRLTDAKLGDLLATLAGDKSLNQEQIIQVQRITRDRDKAVKLPTSLVRELSLTAAKAHGIWAKARQDNDFSAFAPILARTVELKTQEAHALGFPEGGVPYDALLDQFEHGATVATLDPVIEQTKAVVAPAVKAIAEAPVKAPTHLLSRDYDEQGQERFCTAVARAMGLDPAMSRMDRSVHPFTTSFGPRDVRITTRYLRNWLPSAVFGTIHEAGHALYELGLPEEHYGTPLGAAVSLGIHESQSRFWENVIGRSRPFWTHFFPELSRTFPNALAGVSLDDFHLAINGVTPSFIRVEADEVTYNLHIVLRYEMEKALFAGDLAVSDLPAAWNERMQRYLGVTPPTDRDGVLQDIHWSFGGFGYFPTYLLGNLYAAQFHATLKTALPNLDDLVSRGDFAPVRQWLGAHIHAHGQRFSPRELITRVTGQDLDPAFFGAYLKERFADLYQARW